MTNAPLAEPPRTSDRPLDVVLTTEQLWQPQPGGSGTYVRELAGALVRREDVRLTGLHARHAAAPDRSWSLPDGLADRASLLPRPVLYEAWNRWRLPRSAGRPDMVHATTWAVPPRSAPLVVTVHDLAFLRNPEHFTPRGGAFFRRALDVVRSEATLVVAVSGTTRDDCVEAGIEADRVRVVPHGVRVPEVTAEARADFLQRFGLTRPYVLWCGTVEPRKNVAALLRAYTRASREVPDLDLVLAGPAGWAGAPRELARALDELPTGRVHRLGALSWADLHAAYSAARLFCYPSLWEGFGMPVLEAMSHGVPVVTSSGTSMAEVAGTAALLVPPSDVDALAEALVTAAGDRHGELAAAGAQRAARFGWDACAAATVEVYREAAANR